MTQPFGRRCPESRNGETIRPSRVAADTRPHDLQQSNSSGTQCQQRPRRDIATADRGSADRPVRVFSHLSVRHAHPVPVVGRRRTRMSVKQVAISAGWHRRVGEALDDGGNAAVSWWRSGRARAVAHVVAGGRREGPATRHGSRVRHGRLPSGGRQANSRRWGCDTLSRTGQRRRSVHPHWLE